MRLILAIATIATVSCSCTVGYYRPLSPEPFQQDVPPGVEVALSDAATQVTSRLWVSLSEVTQEQFEARMGFNPSRYSRCRDCPVESVSWYDAAAYANRLSDSQGLTPCYSLANCRDTRGREAEPEARRFDTQGPRGSTCESVTFQTDTCTGYRLPTASEWSLIAPAANATESVRQARQYAHFLPNRVSEPGPVARYGPNSYGLYDTLGNVDEWLHNDNVQPSRVRGQRRQDSGQRWCTTAGLCFGSRWNPDDLYDRQAELAHWGRYCLGFRVVRQLRGEPAGEGSGAQ